MAFAKRLLLSLALASLTGCATTDLGIVGSPNGRQGAMPAFYDARPLTINFKEMPSQAAASLLAHNKSINTIYMYPEGSPFASVLDAIQGDGFNPLWQLVEITAGNQPLVQYFSDDEVLAAAAAGAVVLTTTTEVYRCSVIGPKKK